MIPSIFLNSVFSHLFLCCIVPCRSKSVMTPRGGTPPHLCIGTFVTKGVVLLQFQCWSQNQCLLLSAIWQWPVNSCSHVLRMWSDLWHLSINSGTSCVSSEFYSTSVISLHKFHTAVIKRCAARVDLILKSVGWRTLFKTSFFYLKEVRYYLCFHLTCI